MTAQVINKLMAGLAGIGMAISLTACERKAASVVSSEGMRICHERQAEASPEDSRQQIREAYSQCLRTIDAELKADAADARAQAQQEQQEANDQEAEQQASWTSANDRYSYCQQVQQEVIRAEKMRIRRLGPTMVATRQFGADSPEAEAANRDYREAVEELERLLPEPMRAGQPLIPDAVKVFSSCEPGDFKS